MLTKILRDGDKELIYESFNIFTVCWPDTFGDIDLRKKRKESSLSHSGCNREKCRIAQHTELAYDRSFRKEQELELYGKSYMFFMMIGILR